jgi:hypothetical protein
MHRPVPNLVPALVWVSGAAMLRAFAAGENAVSPCSISLREQAAGFIREFEESPALFGVKAEAISHLICLVEEDKSVITDRVSLAITERFIRALPSGFPMPEFSIDPDGCIGLDWIESRFQGFSLHVGTNSRLAYAWIDGTDRGHAVERFDGQKIPDRVLEGIRSVIANRYASVRAS